MLGRRAFLGALSASAMLGPSSRWLLAADQPLPAAQPDDDLMRYIERVRSGWDTDLYRRLLGCANEWKEGDAIVGVAARDAAERTLARQLLASTTLGALDAHPPFEDQLSRALQANIDRDVQARLSTWTLGELRAFLLREPATAINPLLPGLSSDVIAAVVKLMTDAELTAVGAKVFHPLPGSQIGAKGYLGARIQPNSPTDNVDDIRWQVLDGWAYAVGDVVLGNNPVSSDPASVRAIEETLQDLLVTFGLTEALPHCVLSHIDVQAAVEQQAPGSTALWFQSIAGSDAANATFDLTLEKLLTYADSRTGPYGLYFETGQGADFTNGHSHGCDMVLHESRKYGLARLLSQRVAAAREKAGVPGHPWVHVNDVAGFIGPEVFRTKEQLVRCCLEDIVMGKLHGLCIGLDICSTLHMDVTLDDLDWCLERLAPANPGYLMALPTKIDPMLGYLTTGYQDHVRLREKFGLKVNDRMWKFFQNLGVIDAAGQPTEHFGDPLWVYEQYRQRKGDRRDAAELRAEGRQQITEVRARGLFLAEGHGPRRFDLTPALEADIRRIYADAKTSIWAEFDEQFPTRIERSVSLRTQSRDRVDYILHPASGEALSAPSADAVRQLRLQHDGRYDVQCLLSDGLNALALLDLTQLQPLLDGLRKELRKAGLLVAPEPLVLTAGRVRAGYQIGELLFGGLPGPRGLLHIIGERPGSGHRTCSIYLTSPTGAVWGTPGRVDHNLTRVIAGIANTALSPAQAAVDAVRQLQQLRRLA